MRNILLAAILALCCGGAAQAAPEILNVIAQGEYLFIAGSGVVVKYDLTSGRFDVARTQGELVASQAHSEAVVIAGGGPPQTLAMAGDARLSWYKEDFNDAVGRGRRVIITRRMEKPRAELVNILTTYERAAGVLVAIKVVNRGTRGLLVESLSPLVSGPPHGGVFIGLTPDRAQITGAPCADLQLGTHCWFAAALDAAANRGLVAGFVTQTAADVRIEHAFTPGQAPREPQGERTGFSVFRANCLYGPARRVAQGDSFTSETLALIPAWGSLNAELDELAGLAAAHSKASPLQKPVLAAQLTGEDQVLKKEAAAGHAGTLAANSSPPDMIFLDPGPDALSQSPRIKAAADAVRAHGFKPGLVWRPFHVAPDSPIAKKHPKWILANPGTGAALLDISRPDVQEYIKVTATRIVAEWGLAALILEDTQAALGASGFSHKGLPRHELYRNMLARLRKAAGADTIIVLRGAPPLLAAGVAHALLPGSGASESAQHAHGALWALEAMPEPCQPPACADEGMRFARAALQSGVLTLTPDQFERLPAWGSTPLAAFMVFPRVFRAAGPGMTIIKSSIPERAWALLSAENATGDLCRAAGFAGPDGCHGYDVLRGGYADRAKGAKGSALFLARPRAPVPQLLFSNTALTALDRDLTRDYWDAGELALNGAITVVAGRDIHLVFFVPTRFKLAGSDFESAAVNPSAVDLYRQGAILNVRFKTVAGGAFKWALRFTDEEAAPEESGQSGK